MSMKMRVAVLAFLSVLVLAPAFAATREVGPIVSNVVQPLTDAATIEVDGSQAFAFSVTLGGSRTLANPGNLVAGSIYVFQISQDGTGNRTLSYDTNYRFAGGTPPVLSTAASSRDILTFWTDGTLMHSISVVKDMAVELLAPSGLTASTNQTAQITLNWTDNSSNETGFVIQQDDGFGTWSQVGTVGPGITSFVDDGFATTPGDYTYRVLAKRNAVLSTASNSAQGTSL